MIASVGPVTLHWAVLPSGERVAEPVQQLLAQCDETERARAGAYRRAADRYRFVLGATLVRRLGAARLGCPPARVRVRRDCPRCAGPHGPPRLADLPGLYLSVSHSGDLVVLASCPDRWVGVDVQQIPAALEPGVAALILSPGERRAGQDWDTAQLITVWCRKEAVLKCVGSGLMSPMTALTVTGPHEPARVVSGPAAPSPAGAGPVDWRAIELADLPQLPPGYRAAVATGPDRPARGERAR